MKYNVSMIDLEEIWDLKTEAHNNIFNYLESKGLEQEELLEFMELLNKYSESTIKLNHYI